MNLSEHTTSRETRLDLWKYFNDRMLHLKDVLLKVLTWLLGFALAIQGFMVQQKMIGFTSAGFFVVQKENSTAALFFAALGILLCIYCFYLIYAYSKIINGNWLAAGQIRDELDWLKYVYPETNKMKAARDQYQDWLLSDSPIKQNFKDLRFLPLFCRNISFPVIVFLALFMWIFANAAFS